MPHPPGSSMRAHRRRAFLGTLLAALVGLGSAACDVDSGPTGPGEDIQGTWVLSDAAGSVYFLVTANSVSIYSQAVHGECYVRNVYDVLDRDGSIYRLRDRVTGLPSEVVLERSDDALVVTSNSISTTFQQSELDVETLEVCTLETSCEGLPELVPDDTTAAELTAEDPQNPDGTHYDLYALRIDTRTQVRIDMISSDVDAYLVAFTEEGVFMGQDDDGGGDTNARLSGPLDAGCYAIMATTFEAGEVGSYTISVTSS